MTWLNEESVSREFAEAFVRCCCYWDHPTAYSWVHAPKHAKRLRKGSLGWEVEFGANSFLAERAIEWCKKIVRRKLSGDAIEMDQLRKTMSNYIADSVANNGVELKGRYPIDGSGYMRFGTAGINTEKAVTFLLWKAGLHTLGSSDNT